MLQVDLEQGGLNLSRDSEQREIDEFEEEERRLLAEESKVNFFLEYMLVFFRSRNLQSKFVLLFKNKIIISEFSWSSLCSTRKIYWREERGKIFNVLTLKLNSLI